jgi:uncharacterized protein YktB (UPF0637 family)
MNKKREAHLKKIKKILNEKIEKKYRLGAESHKEDMMEKEDLLDEALDELLDCFTYVITELMRQKRVR